MKLINAAAFAALLTATALPTVQSNIASAASNVRTVAAMDEREPLSCDKLERARPKIDRAIEDLNGVLADYSTSDPEYRKLKEAIRQITDAKLTITDRMQRGHCPTN